MRVLGSSYLSIWSERDGGGPIVVRICGSLAICNRVGISLPMVILPRRGSSMSGILLMGAWCCNHSRVMVVAAIQDKCCRIGRVSRV